MKGRYSEVDAILSTALQHDNSVKYYFKKLKKDFSDIKNQFTVECTPLSSKLNKYLEMNITKAQLSTETTSRLVESAILDLTIYINAGDATVDLLAESLDSFIADIIDLYATLLNREVPIMKPVDLAESEIGKILTNSSLDNESVIRNTDNLPATKYEEKIIELIADYFAKYNEIPVSLGDNLLIPVYLFVSDLDVLSSDLHFYLGNLKIDENFIM